MRPLRNVLLALVATLPALSAARAAGPVTQQVERAEAYLAACEALGWSGTVLIEQRGKVVLNEGYGLANRAGSVSAGPATCYEIASVTKTFTAVAVLLLVQDGKLALSDPIGTRLPGVPPERADITLEQLLSHTSGMPREAAGGFGDELEVAVAGYFATPAKHAPGEAHEYWNGGYALLAGIVERASGTSYMEFCRRRIFEPVGMASTGFTGEALPVEVQARGYGARACTLAAEHPYRDSYGWHYRGMRGIVTTAADLLAFVKAVEQGKVLRRASVVDMWTPRAEHYGLGWRIVTSAPKGGRCIGHDGDVDGFHTSVKRFPDDNSTIVVLTNSELVPVWKTAADLEAILFGAPPEHVPLPETFKVSAKALAQLAGPYTAIGGERFAVSAVRDRGLVLEALDAGASALLEGGARTSAELRTDELTVQVVDLLRFELVEPLAAVLAPDVRRYWAERLVETIWPDHLNRIGGLHGFAVRSTRERENDIVEVWADVHGASTVTQLQIVITGDRLRGFDLAPRVAPPDERRYFVLRSRDLFEQHILGGTPSTLRLTLPKGPKKKGSGLELQLDTGGSITLQSAR